MPPTPRFILEQQWPSYGRKVREGNAFVVPDDLPADATTERAYCERAGLKSQLTIPLKVTGAVVGGLGFASFRSRVEWSEELIRPLRLIGDIFTNALARKQADEVLRAREQSLRQAQTDLRALAWRLLTAGGSHHGDTSDE